MEENFFFERFSGRGSFKNKFVNLIGLVTSIFCLVVWHEIGHVLAGGYVTSRTGICWRYGFPHPFIGVEVVHNSVLTGITGPLFGLIPGFLAYKLISPKIGLITLTLALFGSTSDFTQVYTLLMAF